MSGPYEHFRFWLTKRSRNAHTDQNVSVILVSNFQLWEFTEKQKLVWGHKTFLKQIRDKEAEVRTHHDTDLAFD